LKLALMVPPPVVAAVIAGTMWLGRSAAPELGLPAAAQVPGAIALALIGLGFDLSGLVSFWRARTTINPMKPDASSSLVRSGVYTITRNPMYVGMLLMLCAWAVYLGSAWALLGPAAFVAYMNRFQIAPEERALEALFGASYIDYKARVRRWL